MGKLQDKLKLLNQIHGLKKKNTNPVLHFDSSLFQSKSELNFPLFSDSEIFKSDQNQKNDKLFQSISCLLNSHNPENEFSHFNRDVGKFWKHHHSFLKISKKTFLRDNFELNFGTSFSIEDCLFMDIETCGFSGNPLFLIGACYYGKDKMYLEQFFANDYSEEPSVIKGYLDLAKRFKVLVTFNGKNFDQPFICDRSAQFFTVVPEPKLHIDLMWEARKTWKGQLPNFKLQTLEQYFCRRKRTGDLSGAEIPDAYHEFVLNPDDHSKMERAIHHNALDVITLAELLLVLMDVSTVGTYLK